MRLPPIQLEKQKIILIVGIVLALLAVFMVAVYIDQQRKLAEQSAKDRWQKLQASQTSVLIAKRDIPAGGVIDPNALEIKIVPNQFVQPGAVTSLDRISGMTVTTPISKGEQIILSKLSFQPTGSLAPNVPPGKRAITISIDNIASLAGLLKPGDYVDVIALLPIPTQTQEGKTTVKITTLQLFQKVLVLAVGKEMAQTSREEEGSRYSREAQRSSSDKAPLITLALSPQEANLIAFVQEQGKIKLVLRSPTDVKVEPIQPASWETLFSYIMPDQLKEEPQAKGYLEIYRGLNKEKVPLYK